jgi:hypothetical protein
MKRQLQLPDSVDDEYVAMAEALAADGSPGISPEEVMSQTLQTFRSANPTTRILVFDAEQRARLEAALGGLPIVDPEEVISKVQRLAALEIGYLRVDFTPAQWEEMKRKAKRNGRPLEQYANEIAQGMASQWFDCV